MSGDNLIAGGVETHGVRTFSAQDLQPDQFMYHQVSLFYLHTQLIFSPTNLAVSAAALPENTAMQDVDPQDDIVELINLSRHLADRIGSTADGSSTQDHAESGQPPSTTESGLP
ncbi:hypothetical protein PCANC_07727 [Puccinia coronata f. sp. avenae]|uniref:Uncharacterized protein n=1 Tax=Puccinia coronata f. sp. avenae TaxID=200324 RepID=A0A2N5VRE3_9BASI|nr:hypothetical protein PCANC_07727 [Puccinia coronata f. sp. avenae]